MHELAELGLSPFFLLSVLCLHPALGGTANINRVLHSKLSFSATHWPGKAMLSLLRCRPLAMGTMIDHSCSEAEGNIGAQSKSPTLGIGALATNSEGRCHNQASPGGMLRADSCVIPGNIAGRTDYCLEDLMSEDGGELTQIRQTSKPSIMWTQFPLLT